MSGQRCTKCGTAAAAVDGLGDGLCLGCRKPVNADPAVKRPAEHRRTLDIGKLVEAVGWAVKEIMDLRVRLGAVEDGAKSLVEQSMKPVISDIRGQASGQMDHLARQTKQVLGLVDARCREIGEKARGDLQTRVVAAEESAAASHDAVATCAAKTESARLDVEAAAKTVNEMGAAFRTFSQKLDLLSNQVNGLASRVQALAERVDKQEEQQEKRGAQQTIRAEETARIIETTEQRMKFLENRLRQAESSAATTRVCRSPQAGQGAPRR